MIETSPISRRDDATDIARSLDGDPEAFGAVFDRHYSGVFRFVAARLGSDLAEEVASQTFTLAWERRARFDRSYDSARPWLLGIAINLIREHKRAERRQWAAYDRAVHEPVNSSDGFDPRSAVLGDAIAGLSRNDRDIVLLFAWAELTYEEIAQALGLPIGTVRSRLNRARTRLRQAIETENGAST